MEENNKELQTKGAMENAEKKESVKKEPAKRKATSTKTTAGTKKSSSAKKTSSTTTKRKTTTTSKTAIINRGEVSDDIISDIKKILATGSSTSGSSNGSTDVTIILGTDYIL